MAFFSKEVKTEKYFKSETPVAIVYLSCYPAGFGVAKALADKGVKVITLDNNLNSVARYSRKFLSLYRPEIKNSEDLMRFLKDFAKDFKVKPVLCHAGDEDILTLAGNREELEKFIHLAIGRKSSIDLIDKTRQYTILMDKGIPLPETIIASNRDDVFKRLNLIRYPCILKPAISTALRMKTGRKSLFCANQHELIKSAHFIQGLYDNFIIQEYIPGGNDRLYTFGSYISKSRTYRITFTGKKIRQFPPDFGTCRCGVSVHSDDIEQIGMEVLDALNYDGMSQVEFKHDPRDGRLKVMEVNGRAWLWVSLAVACGVNIPFAAYCDAVGKEIPRFKQKREDVVWINLFEDLLNSIHGYRASGYPDYSISFREWFRSIRGKKTHAFFSWDDPVPAVIRTCRFLKSYKGMIKRHKRNTAHV